MSGLYSYKDIALNNKEKTKTEEKLSNEDNKIYKFIPKVSKITTTNNSFKNHKFYNKETRDNKDRRFKSNDNNEYKRFNKKKINNDNEDNFKYQNNSKNYEFRKRKDKNENIKKDDNIQFNKNIYFIKKKILINGWSNNKSNLNNSK
jgi:hypothetical protein